MSVQVFLSYSHKDRRLAHKVKEGFVALGFDVFLAHDDIRVSTAWRREILKSLRKCEIFVPILTEAFTKSKWTDQESGYALARGARIAPLKVDVDPYGFIGEFQARKLKSDSVHEICWAVLEGLKSDSRLGERIRQVAIKEFLKSRTFDDAYKNLRRLTKFRPFSRTQLAEIIKGSSRNQNIYGCRMARPLMEAIIEDARRGKVRHSLILRYQKAMKSWPY
jgi:hypothetical protein